MFKTLEALSVVIELFLLEARSVSLGEIGAHFNHDGMQAQYRERYV